MATSTYAVVAQSLLKGSCSIMETKHISIKITLEGVQGCSSTDFNFVQKKKTCWAVFFVFLFLFLFFVFVFVFFLGGVVRLQLLDYLQTYGKFDRKFEFRQITSYSHLV